MNRNAEERVILKNECEGRYGLTEKDEEASRERVRTFNKIILQNLKSQLKIVSQSYQVSETSQMSARSRKKKIQETDLLSGKCMS